MSPKRHPERQSAKVRAETLTTRAGDVCARFGIEGAEIARALGEPAPCRGLGDTLGNQGTDDADGQACAECPRTAMPVVTVPVMITVIMPGPHLDHLGSAGVGHRRHDVGRNRRRLSGRRHRQDACRCWLDHSCGANQSRDQRRSHNECSPGCNGSSTVQAAVAPFLVAEMDRICGPPCASLSPPALLPRAWLTIAQDWFRINVKKSRHFLDLMHSSATATCDVGTHNGMMSVAPHWPT